MSQTFTERFIQHLQDISGDRGKLATLRMGLIDNQAHATWPLLSWFMNFDKPYQIKVLQTVAGIFGHHPKPTDKGNFGSLCRQMIDEDEKDKIAKGESGPISRHIQYALAADGEEIFPRVRRLALRAKRDEIPINYIQLTEDLLGWQSPFKKDKIRLAWGKAFWETDTTSAVDAPESEENENG
ncbi:MAG: type I-E CRISPR-associated protein Cse2/CasB [Proteobacteria bacterium]|nr:type I-E CRISPR-associated protein Cse2/CasB [Pseudomonadota bacterium]MBU4472096.1 type I-E CRISPR-associated protein Cse2/CasB [Pseudomonadota bacterium]MCG2752905.1 type I-E CRISPR-associated protein Cse2/CasB [Desulfobacteraceae bacterium]